MTDQTGGNLRVVLKSRPVGAPTPNTFQLDDTAIPVPSDGQVLLRTLFLSLDPYMRGRMNDAPSYVSPMEVGAVMTGGTVSRVEQSRHPGFKPGELVSSFGGWQQYSVAEGKSLTKLDAGMKRPSYALGILGMPGFTAYWGLLEIGQPKPGETVVVAAASGAVGAAVGQIAKIKGCRVIGIAGGAQKCRHVVSELGFDACIDHRDANFRQTLAATCSNGIDVYFENVGGAVFDAVLPLLNVKARVPVCGMIANYNDTGVAQGPDRLGKVMRTVLVKRVKMQGFIIYDEYGPRFDEFTGIMGGWLNDGKIKYHEDIVQGLENAPQAFIGLLEGRNFGKLVVQVAR